MLPQENILSKQEYQVEKIVEQRMLGKKIYYLVKWVNYPESSNTWEPLQNMKNAPSVIKEWEKQKLVKNNKNKTIDLKNTKINRTKSNNKKKQIQNKSNFKIVLNQRSVKEEDKSNIKIEFNKNINVSKLNILKPQKIMKFQAQKQVIQQSIKLFQHEQQPNMNQIVKIQPIIVNTLNQEFIKSQYQTIGLQAQRQIQEKQQLQHYQTNIQQSPIQIQNQYLINNIKSINRQKQTAIIQLINAQQIMVSLKQLIKYRPSMVASYFMYFT